MYSPQNTQDRFSSLALTAILGAFGALVVGLVLLILEYKSGFFHSAKPQANEGPVLVLKSELPSPLNEKSAIGEANPKITQPQVKKVAVDAKSAAESKPPDAKNLPEPPEKRPAEAKPPEVEKIPEKSPASYVGGVTVDLGGLKSNTAADWKIVTQVKNREDEYLNRRYLDELRNLSYSHELLTGTIQKLYAGRKKEELRAALAAKNKDLVKERIEIATRYAIKGKTATFLFLVPRVDGDNEDAEVCVSFFGKCRASNEAEVNPLKYDFLPPEGKTIDEAAKVVKFRVGIVADVLYVDIEGTFKYKNLRLNPNADEERKPDFRRIAALFDTAEGCFFITLTGPEKTVAKHKDNFDGWIKAFK